MKLYLKQFFLSLIAVAGFLPLVTLAQQDDKGNRKKEEIVIVRKGDGSGNVTVEVKDDKVTINGKPIEEYKGDGVIVERRKIRDPHALMESIGGGRAFAPGEKMSFFKFDDKTAYLGVTTEKTDKGVEVLEVSEGSAAEKAGLKKGDIIKSIGDTKIETPDDLSKTVKKSKPGDKVMVSYERDNKKQTTTAELKKWDSKGIAGNIAPMMDQDFNFEDMDFERFYPQDRVAAPRIRVNGQAFNWSGIGGEKIGLSVQDTDEGKGVKVIEVDEESNAAKAGLKTDDIITEIDGKEINDADEAVKALRAAKSKVSIPVKYKRGNKTNTVEVKIPRKLKTADL